MHTSQQTLLEESLFFLKFAIASFGWVAVSTTFDLKDAFKSFVVKTASPHDENIRTLLEYTGINKEDLLCAEFESNDQLPAYFVALCHEKKKLVISIRGTYSFKDIVTDLNGKAGDFFSGHAHVGMAGAAFLLSEKLRPLVDEQLKKHPDYEVVVTGHSLGAVSFCFVLFFVFNEIFSFLKLYKISNFSLCSSLLLSLKSNIFFNKGRWCTFDIHLEKGRFACALLRVWYPFCS